MKCSNINSCKFWSLVPGPGELSGWCSGGASGLPVCALVTYYQLLLRTDTPSLQSPRRWAMPKIPPFRRKLSARGLSSRLSSLFPHTQSRLSHLRDDVLPSLQRRAQSRIYSLIVARQAARLAGRTSLLQRLRGHTRSILRGRTPLDHAVLIPRHDCQATNRGSLYRRKGAVRTSRVGVVLELRLGDLVGAAVV